MSSPGVLSSYLNAKIGQPYGPSARVVGIQSLQGYPAGTGSYLHFVAPRNRNYYKYLKGWSEWQDSTLRPLRPERK